MPYNTSAISRPEEVTGTSALPLARVKKIIAQDEDIAQCSNGAAFAISIATEEFLRYITEQAFNVAKSEAKPRRNIAYKDIAAAVAKFDNLQFLSDTVPKTITYKQYKEKKATDEATRTNTDGKDDNGTTLNGDDTGNRQRSIAHMIQGRASTNGTTNGVPPTPHRRNHSMAHSPIVDRTIQPEQNGHAHPELTAEDVEMRD